MQQKQNIKDSVDSFTPTGDSYKGYVKDKHGDLYYHNGNGYYRVDNDSKFYVKAKFKQQNDAKIRSQNIVEDEIPSDSKRAKFRNKIGGCFGKHHVNTKNPN